MSSSYSNELKTGTQTTELIRNNLYSSGYAPVSVWIASLSVSIDPWELQVLTPA